MTEREQFVIRAALSYALANLDDLNGSLEECAGVLVVGAGGWGEQAGTPVTGAEVERLLDAVKATRGR